MHTEGGHLEKKPTSLWPLFDPTAVSTLFLMLPPAMSDRSCSLRPTPFRSCSDAKDSPPAPQMGYCQGSGRQPELTQGPFLSAWEIGGTAGGRRAALINRHGDAMALSPLRLSKRFAPRTRRRSDSPEPWKMQ